MGLDTQREDEVTCVPAVRGGGQGRRVQCACGTSAATSRQCAYRRRSRAQFSAALSGAMFTECLFKTLLPIRSRKRPHHYSCPNYLRLTRLNNHA
ncbi:unnamed protein product [Pieris macdunnoughi]|uniref:Uncharacterized protein n=1 Tax=Pieris macdunnoughi TaxID=345717 RepID=A0A821R2Q2_9NEOP|nr:unnamed protein product [Pieris macdunnoughi]